MPNATNSLTTRNRIAAAAGVLFASAVAWAVLRSLFTSGEPRNTGPYAFIIITGLLAGAYMLGKRSSDAS